jgi:hypothetical protein
MVKDKYKSKKLKTNNPPEDSFSDYPKYVQTVKNSRSSYLLSLEESINNSLKTGFLYFVDQKIRIFEAFPLAVGQTMAQRAKAAYYEMGKLTVQVSEPAFLERCQYLKKDWIQRLNIELGYNLINEIELKLVTRKY